MNRSIRFLMKIGISFAVIVLIFIGAAILSVKSLKKSLKTPLVYDKYNFEELGKLYSDGRSADVAQKFQKNITTLSETGSCINCDLLTTRNDLESERRDIFNAIQNAKLRGKNINLSGANLFMARLAGVDLSGADLHDANLLGADLNGANLSKTNLSGANLDGAKLNGANLEGADLTGAYMGIAQLTEANLTNATLHQARLSHANLRKANFTNAILTEALIAFNTTTDAKFINTDFSNARIVRRFDSTADLTGAKFDNWFMRFARVFPLYMLYLKEGLYNRFWNK